MQRMCLIIILTCALVSAAQAQITVSGWATKDYYMSMMASGSQPEYKVHLTIKNTGPSRLDFDTLLAVWLSREEATPLIQVTVPHESKFRLNRGESQEFDFQTNGYTYSMLSDAEGVSLKFAFMLRRGGRQASNLYYAVLPSLDKLPNYFEVYPKGHKLTFLKMQD